MTTNIFINKDSSVNQKKFRVNKKTLYKKCGCNKSDEFKLQTTCLVETCNIHSIELWSKDEIDSEYENCYTFFPDLNIKKYYGTIALLAINEKGAIVSMNIETWEKIYKYMMRDEFLTTGDSSCTSKVEDVLISTHSEPKNIETSSESDAGEYEVNDNNHFEIELEEEEYGYSDSE